MVTSGILDDLRRNLAVVGLRILHVGPADVPDTPFDRGSAMIVGQVGSEMWPAFSQSQEFADGQPDPLDRWSRRVISACAPDLPYLNPSDGPPFLPMMALTAGGAYSSSPLGLQVHSQFGLWTAFRGILFTNEILPASPAQAAPNPEVFAACYGACPGGSLPQGGRLDAFACGKNLLRDPHAPCWQGCLARRACPLGQNYGYQDDHARFHAKAYARSVAKRLEQGLIS